MDEKNPNANAGDTAQGASNDSEPQYATLDQITDATSEMINKALTARNKQVESRVEKMLGDKLAELNKSFEDKLAKLLEANTQKSESVESSKKDTKSAPVEDNPAVKELQSQLAKVTKQLETTEREKKVETARARDKELRQKLSDELVKAGVDPARVKHAVGILVDSEKCVRYVDDTDEIVFLNSEGEEADLKSGTKSWIKTDDGKFYALPKGTRGSGERPTSKQGTTPSSSDPKAEMNGILAEAWTSGLFR